MTYPLQGKMTVPACNKIMYKILWPNPLPPLTTKCHTHIHTQTTTHTPSYHHHQMILVHSLLHQPWGLRLRNSCYVHDNNPSVLLLPTVTMFLTNPLMCSATWIQRGWFTQVNYNSQPWQWYWFQIVQTRTIQ